MNILFISTSDLHGGAAIAAFRLMNALPAEEMNVNMLVRDKRSSNGNVIEVGNKTINEWNFLWNEENIHGKSFFPENFSTYPLPIPVFSLPNPEFQHADIIHLHWINQGCYR